MAGNSEIRLGKRVVYIHHSSRSESSVDIERGVVAGAELLGCEVVVYDPDFDQSRRRKCVEHAIESSPDLIVAAVVSPALLPDLFEAVAERGIPWVEAGARQEWSVGLAAQAVPDEDAMTALLDTWLIGQLAKRYGEQAEVALGAWVATALGPGLGQRDARRRADFGEHSLVREVFTHDIHLAELKDDIRSSTFAALDEHPEIAALWQTCEPCVATQAEVLTELNRFGDDRPMIAGFYSNAVTRGLVARNEVDGLVQVDTRVQGLAAIDLAYRHWMSGEPWHAHREDALAPYRDFLGRPWMITRDTVGDNPAVLDPPGPDPLAFFAQRWSEGLHPRSTN